MTKVFELPLFQGTGRSRLNSPREKELHIQCDKQRVLHAGVDVSASTFAAVTSLTRWLNTEMSLRRMTDPPT